MADLKIENYLDPKRPTLIEANYGTNIGKNASCDERVSAIIQPQSDGEH